jgi:hypothetical protein
MCEMDSFEKGHAAVLNYKTRESLLLSRGRAPSERGNWKLDMRAIRAILASRSRFSGQMWDAEHLENITSKLICSQQNRTHKIRRYRVLREMGIVEGLVRVLNPNGFDPNVASVPRPFRLRASGRNKFHPSMTLRQVVRRDAYRLGIVSRLKVEAKSFRQDTLQTVHCWPLPT